MRKSVVLCFLLAIVAIHAHAQSATVVNFNNCPIGNLTGVFGGINWSGTPWDCEKAGYSVGTTASWNNKITRGSFSFVSPSVLTGFLGAGKKTTITISTDAGESISTTLPSGLTSVLTGFSKPATKITVTNSAGWNLELGNITYLTGPYLTGPQAPSISISPASMSLAINSAQQFTAAVIGESNTAVNWSTSGGTIVNGLYTAPSTPGTYTVTAASAADAALSATATITVNTVNVIFYDNFPGPTLSSAWTVISRHGEYAQDETECNIPQMVTVNNGLTITTDYQHGSYPTSWFSCGDFLYKPSPWPYITGDIQWSTFNFTYGTVNILAKFPNSNTNLWPATWMLSSNCQYTNPLTGNTGLTINGHDCPDVGASGYYEIDMTECYNSGGWCQFNVANPGFSCGGPYAVDTNWHLFTTVWTSANVKQYMDGKLVGTCSSRNTPMFLIIQTQTGGVGGTPNNSHLPAQLQIGYVQVTQP